MVLPRINAVASAVPAHRFTQEDIVKLARYTDVARLGFFGHSDIEGRYLYLDPKTFNGRGAP
jgi:hypothetical protein